MFTKSYSPKNWKKKDNKAIASGARALKRKASEALGSIDEAVNYTLPSKAKALKSTLMRKKAGAVVAGKSAKRTLKATSSQFLKKLAKWFK